MGRAIKNTILFLLGVGVLFGVIYIFAMFSKDEMSENEQAAYIDGYHAGIQAYADSLQYVESMNEDVYALLDEYEKFQSDNPEFGEDGRDYFMDRIDPIIVDYLRYAAEEAEYQCLENE